MMFFGRCPNIGKLWRYHEVPQKLKLIFVLGLVKVYKKLWKDPPCSMGKSTVSMAIFNSFLYVYQRVYDVFLEISHKQKYGGTTRYPKIERKLLMINGNASMQTGMG